MVSATALAVGAGGVSSGRKRTGESGIGFPGVFAAPRYTAPRWSMPPFILGSVCRLWTTAPVYTGTTTVRHLSTLLLLLLTPDAVAQSGALLRSGFFPFGAQHLDTAGDPSPLAEPLCMFVDRLFLW